MMGFSLTFNGYNLAAYGLTVAQHPMPLLADIRLDYQDYGDRDGGVVQGASLKPRYMNVEGVVLAHTRRDLQDNMDDIKAVLDPRNGSKLMSLDSWPDRGWYGVLNGPINAQPLGGSGLRVQLNFALVDGVAVSLTETTQTVSVDETPEGFNCTAAGVVAGNEVTRPVWLVTNTAAGTITSVVLANTTRSETMTWTGSLAQNNILRIDSDRLHVEKSTDGGTTYTNNLLYTSAASEWPKLTGGVQNACTLTGVTAGSVVVTYRARWI